MFGLEYVIRLFEKHSVAVCGMKGSGKDLLCSNVVDRRGKPYASNMDYKCSGEYIPLKLSDLNCKNSYDDLINGNIKYYECPYPEGCDIILSDAGIYLPAQYCNELNKKYPYIPTTVSVLRHLNNSRFHYNCQNLNRVWDKIREHCDYYIYCNWSVYLFGLVIQSITVYDKASSCQDRVKPPVIRTPVHLINDQNAEMNKQIYLDKFRNTYGLTKKKLLIYFNKSNYDTRYFKQLFANGRKDFI